ncbi:MAG: hypothetical protein M3Y05_10385 [Gemmatimonadota bacterium]|nr:hypothetical protein [Gemmatimonadota bacterium]
MEANSASQIPLEAFLGESSYVSTQRRLRSSLQTIFQNAGLRLADVAPGATLDLRAALSQVCADARHSGMRAEQLLVLIKDVWSELPAGIARMPSAHGDERLNYVITTCVDEYYAHAADAREGTP